MPQIAILSRKCDGCGRCAAACPFQAIDMEGGAPRLNAACRLCGACVRACPRGAIVELAARQTAVDKAAYSGILVFCEHSGGKLHPVSLELIGEARRLSPEGGVRCALVGSGVAGAARELRHYGVDAVYVYDDPALGFFRADAFAACVEDAVGRMKPHSVLTGATALGRSLAPRVSTRLRTGLTADCTRLELRENTDLVQIRPAFGGNIMAQIVTAGARPQCATVRYKVMSAPARTREASGELISCALPRRALESRIALVRTEPAAPCVNISDAEVIVACGRGLKRAPDLQMVRELAQLLGGEYAVSRPLVEKGWADNTRQIGLSGRTVRPKLIIALGISGAIQFAACMNQSERIIAINEDERAPIFGVAHVGIVGDLYKIVPELIRAIKGGTCHAEG